MTRTAPELIVAARLSAGISQAELARRTGLPRSVLNAYERGRRDPGSETLAAVLAGAGRELRAAPAVRRLDAERAARILEQVIQLAEALPYRPRPLRPSPFARRS
ncbi:MAG: helix-turn-helix domain-containing protein [Actinobacteria bacterium]|nr:helix-turn-helix domain-containing protein [Actinomycetota bacterium]